MDASNTPSAAQQHNRRAWDSMVRDKQRFTRPARDEDFRDPLKTVDEAGWLGGDIRGKRLLCLAAGGGRQGALYAAAGASVTVVDISAAMLELDRQVAAERKLDVRTVEASMDDLPMFAHGAFDIVIHPVSTCYVEDIMKVYREVARIMRSGGIYISQHKTPTSLQTGIQSSASGYEIVEPYYRSGPLPNVEGSRLREEGTLITKSAIAKEAGLNRKTVSVRRAKTDRSEAHRVGAYKTASIKRAATESKIKQVIDTFLREGRRITKSAIAKEVGISREAVSKCYAHLFPKV